jgi:hypothetical protein
LPQNIESLLLAELGVSPLLLATSDVELPSGVFGIAFGIAFFAAFASAPAACLSANCAACSAFSFF